MKDYTQFLVTNNNILMEAMGSDGVCILDGRNNLQTMKIDAMLRMNKLQVVRPNLVGYRVYKSERFDNKNLLYQWVISGTIYDKVIDDDGFVVIKK